MAGNVRRKIGGRGAAYHAAGIEIVIHVVGFDVREPPRETIGTDARLGRGKYYGALNAEELTEALESAIEATGYVVRDESGAKEAGQGLINGDPVPLKPGKYRVSVLGTRIEPLASAGRGPAKIRDDEGNFRPRSDSKLFPVAKRSVLRRKKNDRSTPPRRGPPRRGPIGGSGAADPGMNDTATALDVSGSTSTFRRYRSTGVSLVSPARPRTSR
jgi:hypothetical protein